MINKGVYSIFRIILYFSNTEEKNHMISIGKEIRNRLPNLQLAVISCLVQNTVYNEHLWQEVEAISKSIRKDSDFEQIKNQPNIKACKDAYRILGKDPNRYRPSAESLRRRIVKGNELYQITTVVDIINLVSLQTGYSIGGFDQEKVKGKIELGVGNPGEPYEGIGRGALNIENLPVYRDEEGGIGTPTSDHIRTAITLETNRLLMVINHFAGERDELEKAVNLAIGYLKKFVEGKEVIINYIAK